MFGNRLGFLKFKADVIDKETGQKVLMHDIKTLNNYKKELDFLMDFIYVLNFINFYRFQVLFLHEDQLYLS